MGMVALRIWGVGLWCVLGAACLARTETESGGTAAGAGSGGTGSAPLCGLAGMTGGECEHVSQQSRH